MIWAERWCKSETIIFQAHCALCWIQSTGFIKTDHDGHYYMIASGLQTRENSLRAKKVGHVMQTIIDDFFLQIISNCSWNRFRNISKKNKSLGSP